MAAKKTENDTIKETENAKSKKKKGALPPSSSLKSRNNAHRRFERLFLFCCESDSSECSEAKDTPLLLWLIRAKRRLNRVPFAFSVRRMTYSQWPLRTGRSWGITAFQDGNT